MVKKHPVYLVFTASPEQEPTITQPIISEQTIIIFLPYEAVKFFILEVCVLPIQIFKKELLNRLGITCKFSSAVLQTYGKILRSRNPLEPLCRTEVIRSVQPHVRRSAARRGDDGVNLFWGTERSMSPGVMCRGIWKALRTAAPAWSNGTTPSRP